MKGFNQCRLPGEGGGGGGKKNVRYAYLVVADGVHKFIQKLASLPLRIVAAESYGCCCGLWMTPSAEPCPQNFPADSREREAPKDAARTLQKVNRSQEHAN